MQCAAIYVSKLIGETFAISNILKLSLFQELRCDVVTMLDFTAVLRQFSIVNTDISMEIAVIMVIDEKVWAIKASMDFSSHKIWLYKGKRWKSPPTFL